MEETPKKLRDVILVTHRLRHRNAEDLKQDSKVLLKTNVVDGSVVNNVMFVGVLGIERANSLA